MDRTDLRRARLRTWLAIGVACLAVGALSGTAAARGHGVPRTTLIPNPTATSGQFTQSIGLFYAHHFQGMLASVTGCSVGAVIIGPAAWNTTDLSLGRQTSTPCVLEHGLLGDRYMDWLSGALDGGGATATLDIVTYKSTSSVPPVAIELTGAHLVSVDFPGLNAASSAPATIRSTVVADDISFVSGQDFPRPAPTKRPMLTQGLFRVDVNGILQSLTRSVAPLSVDALFGDGVTDPRTSDATGVFHPGGLRLVVAPNGEPYFVSWLGSLLAGEPEPEREVAITYLNPALKPVMELRLHAVGISGADPGLDLTRRSFDFYVESVSLTVD